MAAITAAITSTSTQFAAYHLIKLSSLSIQRPSSLPTLSLCFSTSLNSPSSSSTLINDFHTTITTFSSNNSHAPPKVRSSHALSEKKVKQEGDNKTTKKSGSEEPKHSKAVRRFYNEKFRESQAQRLAKVLAAAGVASRRSSEELIFQGKVTVNGSVCDTPQTRVDPARDVIYVNGNRLPKKLPPKLYLALNKPKGYICSSGEKEFKSILSLCEGYLNLWDKRNPGQQKPRLFTVGRLDVATTGLIIATNDGDFAQKVSHPSSNLTKEYIAAVDGEVHKQHLMAISNATIIDGVHCTPESVELLPRQPDITRARIRIVVNEGRNHEVRELVKNAGLEAW